MAHRVYPNRLTPQCGTAALEDPTMAKRLGYMRAGAERGARLTDQLLAFSSRQRLEPKPLDLNESMAGMRDLMQSTIGGSFRIDTRQDDSLWQALVDPTQLELAVLRAQRSASTYRARNCIPHRKIHRNRHQPGTPAKRQHPAGR
jgi:hypothetical protein